MEMNFNVLFLAALVPMIIGFVWYGPLFGNAWMKEMGFKVIMDSTHSLQQPNNGSGTTGGLPQLIEPMAKAAVAVGVDGFFIETHPDPSTALSDGANMLPLNKMEDLLTKLLRVRESIS